MRPLPAIGLLTCLATFAPALEGPQPLPWDQSDALAWVAVPSLDGLLTQLEGSARVFDPGQATQLRQEIERNVGPAVFNAIDQQKTVAAVLLPGTGMPPSPRWAVVLTAKDPEPLKMLAADGGGLTTAEGELLLIGSDQAVIDRKDEFFAAYRALPASFDGDPAIQGDVAVTRAMQLYGPMAKASLPMIPMMMGMAGGGNAQQAQQMQAMAPLLVGVAQTYLTLMEDIEHVSFRLRLGDSPRLEKAILARPDSVLAGAFATPSEPTAWRQAWQRLPESPTMMSYALTYDAEGVRALYKHVLTTLQKQPALATMFDQELIQAVENMLAAIGPTVAATMRSEPEHFFQQDVVFATPDGEAFLGRLETLMRGFETSALADMYRQMGMPMAFSIERELRSVDETAIHRLRFFAPEVASNPQLQMSGMGGMFGPMEVAITDGWYLASHDPLHLDHMITGEQTGLSEPKALAAFGDDLTFVMDYDYGYLLQATFANMMGGPAPTGPNERPIMVGGKCSGGSCTAVIEVPLAPIRKAMNALMGPPPAEIINPQNPGF